MTSVTSPQQTDRRGTDEIPGPRGGQGVRLLVLGADPDAQKLRDQAAAAGYELAQRYSARVSHVAYGSGVDPADSRYTKIRDAGLVLLPLQKCAEELGLRADTAPTQAAADEAREGEQAETETVTTTAAETEAEEAEAEAREAEIETVAEIQIEAEAEAGEAETEAGVDLQSGADRKIETALKVEVAAETFQPVDEASDEPVDGASGEPVDGASGEPVDGASGEPVDGASGEAVDGASGEAVDEAPLEIPPLRSVAEETTRVEAAARAQTRAGEIETEDADKASAADFVPGFGHDPGDVRGPRNLDHLQQPGKSRDSDHVPSAAVAIGADQWTGGEGAIEDIVEVPAAPAPAPASASAAARPGAGHVLLSVLWALVPFATFGLLTPFTFGYAAYRLRSRALVLSALGYTLAVLASFVLSAARPHSLAPSDTVGALLTVCLVGTWIGGTLHAVGIRARVFTR